MQDYYQLDITDGILCLCFFRKPSMAEMKRAIEQASMLGKMRLRLWVFPETCLFSEEELCQIRNEAKKIWPGPGRAAIFAHERLAVVVQSHMDKIVESQEYKTKVFCNKDDAVSWLLNGE